MSAGAAPLISVIVTSYNYLHYITQAIDSARAQTYPNLEIVIVDNCSTDGTVPALRTRYRDDPRVRIFENERNIGQTANVNRGFELSRGELVAWLSADDWLLPRHIARLAAVFAREPQIDIVHSAIYFGDAEGRIRALRQMSQLPFDYVDARDELLDMLFTKCPLSYPSALWRRTVFDDVGLEDPDSPVHATDWEMQVRVALAGKRFAFLADASCVVRLHAEQQTGQRYIAEAHNVDDFVGILEKFVDWPVFLERTRGREAGISAHLDALVRDAGGALGSTTHARAQALRTTLLARAAAYEPAMVRGRTISVILPIRQAPQLTARAIASVEHQSHPNWELVVVDNGRLPLEEVLRAHPLWDRIAYARPNRAQAARARNDGLRLARGEYLAFLDEDNTYEPHHLATLVDAIERAGTSIAASGARCVVENADDELVAFDALAELPLYRSPSDPAELSLIAPVLPLDAVMFYRHILDRAQPFDERFPILEDFEYVMRLEHTAPIALSGAVTVDVRVRAQLNNPLGAHLQHYLASLDLAYALHPVDERVAARRAAHRAAVAAAIERVVGQPVGLPEIAALLAAMAGRSVGPAFSRASGE